MAALAQDHADVERTLVADGPLDLHATLGRREVWRASRTPAGLATLRIHGDGPRVVAHAWGPGADWSIAQLPALLGFAEDQSSFVALHPIVRQLHRDHRGLRLGRTQLVWETLAPTVLGQKVTATEAHRSWRSLVRAYGEPAPGPTVLHAAPAPAVIAALPYYALHEHGIERKRAETLIRCARAADGLEAITALPRAEAYDRLMAVPGVGIWTAAAVMATAWGDTDAVPVGDFHVPNTVSWALAGEPRGTDARMLELLEPYRPQRARVVRLLQLGAIRAPRRGPRLAPRDIRGW